MNLIYPYVASENFIGSQNWVRENGLRPAGNVDALAEQMQYIADNKGESVYEELKSIHPDKELFSSYSGSGHSNACGCSNMMGYMNANGQNHKKEVERVIEGKDRDSKVELMILAGTVLVALALITRK